MLRPPRSAGMPMHTVTQSTLIRSAVALLALVVGVARGEPAFGAIGALCLLAWACLDHSPGEIWRARERTPRIGPGHARLVAENAATHLLDDFDAFTRSASPAALAAFQREFERERDAWRTRGRTMPHYVVMALVRRAEAADRGAWR